MYLQSFELLRPTSKEKYIINFDLKCCSVFDLVSGNVAQYPLHHVTSAPAKFGNAMSKGLGGDALTRKYMI